MINKSVFLVALSMLIAAKAHDLGFVRPSFADSMAVWGKYNAENVYDKNLALKNVYSQKAHEAYDAFWRTGLQLSSVPRIPKIIHQIWLGSPLPQKYKVLQQSWRKYHPDWTYILWTDKEIAEFGLVNKKLFDSARNWGQKSDIARYEILCRMGGLYIDTDFECLKSFDILHDSLDFYTCCIPAKDGGVEIINALIAACPGHPILKACVNGLHNVTASTNIWHIIETTGPYFFTKAVFAFLTGRSVIFPVTYFYPMPAWIASQKPNHADVIQRFVKDESFALHWWDCSWQRLRLFKKGLDNEKF